MRMAGVTITDKDIASVLRATEHLDSYNRWCVLDAATKLVQWEMAGFTPRVTRVHVGKKTCRKKG